MYEDQHIQAVKLVSYEETAGKTDCEQFQIPVSHSSTRLRITQPHARAADVCFELRYSNFSLGKNPVVVLPSEREGIFCTGEWGFRYGFKDKVIARICSCLE